MPHDKEPSGNPSPSAFVPVAIYTRVSTDNQVGGRFDSCESQAVVCRDVVARRANEGWSEVACLTDMAYSGGTMDRPGIRTLKRMIEAGEVKVVLIYKLERVLRSTDEWVPFRAFLKKHGCRLESATEDISESTPSGRLKNMLMMSFNQYERENTAEKTTEKMRQQARRGIWNGGNIPYGYSYDKNTQALQPHPEEAAVVKRVFEQAARLVSLTELANALNADGLRTKVRVFQRRDGSAQTVGGRLFRSDGLRLMLRNPLYRGSVKFDGQEFTGRHAALVASDLWEKAVAATAETEARPERIFRERDMHNHLLKGIAWCASCRRALVPNDSGKKSTSGVKYRYYTCSLVMRETAAAPCPVGRLSADALEKATIALIAEASRHPTVIAEMIAASRTIRRGDRAGLRAEINRLSGELAEVDKKLSNCADAVAKGGAAVLGEALARRAAEFRQERQQVLVLLERKRQELALCDSGALEEKRITENLEKLGQTLPILPAAEQKELIRLFIERVEVSRYEPPPKAKKATESVAEPAGRVMQLRLKLHLPELVQGMQERAEGGRTAVSVRGLSLDGRVDFTHAQQGEFSIVTPFRQTVRLDARVRTVPVPKATPTHPILRAQRWQRMLDEKQVPHRFALAKKVGCTPGAVTKMLKLIKLLPEIQEYLAALKGQREIWHFSAKRMSTLSTLEAEMQRRAFERICRDFAERIADQLATGKQIGMPTQPAVTQRISGRGISAG